MSGTCFLQCFNPFKLENHRVRGIKRLRHVTPSQLNTLGRDEKLVNLFICDTCRLKVSKLSKETISDTESSTSESIDNVEISSASTLSDVQALPMDTEGSSSASSPKHEGALVALNQTLISLGESPIKKRKLSQKSYPKDKFRKIQQAIGQKVLCVDLDREKAADDENGDIIMQLKEAFHQTDDRNLKIRILTLFSNWPIAKIQTHFNATKHMITVAKKVKEEKGMLSCPDSRRGKRLDDTIIKKIVDFYELDDISRTMPGTKDYITVLENGQKVQKQKRLVLCNLKEAYAEFKQRFRDEKQCGFSKFAELRPKHCVLAGASGTHTVCVCLIHENVKLMFDGGKIARISETMPKSIATYRDCLDLIVCNPPTEDCYLNHCTECPGVNNLIDDLQSAYDKEMIETVTYRQWVTVDRATLETMQSLVPDFLQKVSAALRKLLPHAFIAKQQSDFLRKAKENLTNEECIVTGDFSENYAFVFQDAIQGVHWNNNQATLHPFVIYYKEESELKHKSFAAISNCLKHDTVAVHLFQGNIIELIKNTVKNVKKLIYFTDGAAAQYKNKKNFINICHHHDDFGLDAEWHFFATSHGKGPCDGIGATIKRSAARACLQRPNLIIKTAKDLYNWAKTNIPSVECVYFTKEDYGHHEKVLQPRFELAKPLTGTKKFRLFIPVGKKQIEVREYSFSKKQSLAKIMK